MGVSGTQDEVIHLKSRSEELPKSALAWQFWVKSASPSSPPPHRITESEHLELEGNHEGERTNQALQNVIFLFLKSHGY